MWIGAWIFWVFVPLSSNFLCFLFSSDYDLGTANFHWQIQFWVSSQNCNSEQTGASISEVINEAQYVITETFLYWQFWPFSLVLQGILMWNEKIKVWKNPSKHWSCSPVITEMNTVCFQMQCGLFFNVKETYLQTYYFNIDINTQL